MPFVAKFYFLLVFKLWNLGCVSIQNRDVTQIMSTKMNPAGHCTVHECMKCMNVCYFLRFKYVCTFLFAFLTLFFSCRALMTQNATNRFRRKMPSTLQSNWRSVLSAFCYTAIMCIYTVESMFCIDNDLYKFSSTISVKPFLHRLLKNINK